VCCSIIGDIKIEVIENSKEQWTDIVLRKMNGLVVAITVVRIGFYYLVYN
jgi:hypothetical protein